MRELPLEDWILQLHREALAAADPIFRRQGAAEHRVTGFQRITTHQILGRADGGDRALLIELAVCPGAQHQALPVQIGRASCRERVEYSEGGGCMRRNGESGTR